MIPSSNIVLDDPLPYNAKQDDPLLRGPESLCYKNAPDHLESCPSQACLLAGAKSDDGKNMMEACCAWDLHIWLVEGSITPVIQIFSPQPVPGIPAAGLFYYPETFE